MTVSLFAELQAIVGPQHLLTDPEVCLPYETDATGRFGARAAAVVRPANRTQVIPVLEACKRHRVPVVPQGGNTGLVGGGVPQEGEVVLSLQQLRDISTVDTITREVTVGAGVTLAEIQGAARAAGMEFGLDFGARCVTSARVYMARIR